MNKVTLFLVLLCTSWGVAFSLIDGLLPNGNFEQGPKPSEMNGTKVLAPDAIPNWEISGFVEYIKSGQTEGDMLLVVPEGTYAVRLGNDGQLKTKARVVNGLFHALTFSVARTCAQAERLNVSVWPNPSPKDWGVLPMQTMYSVNGWDSFSWGFLAQSTEVEIAFHHPQKNPACGPLIDMVALKAFPPPKSTKDILKNGNFEEGPYVFPNTSWGVMIPTNIDDDHSPLLGWMVESLKAVRYIDSDHFAVPEGKRAVELVGGRESVVAQVARTVPDKVYDLAFFIGDARNNCEGSMLVEVFAGNTTFQVPYESKGKGGSKLVKIQLKAVSARTRVRFLSGYYHMKTDNNSGTLCGPVIDDVRLFSVPQA